MGVKDKSCFLGTCYAYESGVKNAHTKGVVVSR